MSDVMSSHRRHQTAIRQVNNTREYRVKIGFKFMQEVHERRYTVVAHSERSAWEKACEQARAEMVMLAMAIRPWAIDYERIND